LVIKVGLFCSAINTVYKPHNKDITIYNKGERRAKCNKHTTNYRVRWHLHHIIMYETYTSCNRSIPQFITI